MLSPWGVSCRACSAVKTETGVATGGDARRGVREGAAAGGPGGGASAAEGESGVLAACLVVQESRLQLGVYHYYAESTKPRKVPNNEATHVEDSPPGRL